MEWGRRGVGRYTSSEAQELLLTLHEGIRPSGAEGTIEDAGDQAWVSCVQGKELKALTTVHSVRTKCFLLSQ